MNENLANEIRKTIESVKDMKIQVGGINNYLSILEGMIRADYQKQVDEACQRGYNKGYADKTNNDEVCNELAKDIYQRGLNDAWEAARKIVLNPNEGGITVTDLFAIFGERSVQSAFKYCSASEAIAKLKAYEEKQKVDEKPLMSLDEAADILREFAKDFGEYGVWKIEDDVLITALKVAIKCLEVKI